VGRTCAESQSQDSRGHKGTQLAMHVMGVGQSGKVTSDDGIARVATVKTVTWEIKRSTFALSTTSRTIDMRQIICIQIHMYCTRKNTYN